MAALKECLKRLKAPRPRHTIAANTAAASAAATDATTTTASTSGTAAGGAAAANNGSGSRPAGPVEYVELLFDVRRLSLALEAQPLEGWLGLHGPALRVGGRLGGWVGAEGTSWRGHCMHSREMENASCIKRHAMLPLVGTPSGGWLGGGGGVLGGPRVGTGFGAREPFGAPAGLHHVHV